MTHTAWLLVRSSISHVRFLLPDTPTLDIAQAAQWLRAHGSPTRLDLLLAELQRRADAARPLSVCSSVPPSVSPSVSSSTP
jgi:hypothetical protein